MLSFFKKKNGENPKLEGNESVVSSKDFLNEESANQTEDEIMTSLSLHPSWNLQKEDLYAFQFLNMECPPLKPNQLSLSGISMNKAGEDLQITAFVRNSLEKAIKLEETTLVLLGTTDEVLGRKAFHLADLGEIPGKSSRPWNFIFTKKDLFTTDLPSEGWKLAFQINPSSRKHSLDLADSWEQSLASAEKDKLRELVEKMPPPKQGEVNFLGLQANVTETGDLHVTMLVRNGSEKNLNLEQLPLQVEDANGDIIAKGGFKLEEFQVKANTSKPWTFIFPKSLVLKENADLSKWKAYPPQ